MNIVREADDVFVSSASVWEMAIKVRIGKMKVDIDRVNDPFDRLLIAQAMIEPLHLLTANKQLKPYSKDLIVCI